MTFHPERDAAIRAAASWARRVREEHPAILASGGARAHIRPSSSGVTVIGLTPERPQRGSKCITNLARLERDFEEIYRTACLPEDHGRPTPEKRLQSALIRESLAHDRELVSLTDASNKTQSKAHLRFVTDELALPPDKIVCDLLALREDDGACVPVVIELKSKRDLARLVEQTQKFAAIVDAHRAAFEELYAAVLGRSIAFSGPAERWIVWPGDAKSRDPKEEQLRSVGVRVVSYSEDGGSYAFRCGIGV